jgi:osmotically-inducible protein OsmY
MSRKMMTTLALAALVVGTSSGALYAQDHEKVNSPNAMHEQTSKHLTEVVKTLSTLGTPETTFDYIHPAVSGPVVVLQGFTVNGALKDNAAAQVQKLEWCTHVVNEIELLDVGPELRRVRQQTLAILKKQVPQAFPERHANIRIKVTLKGEVTLVGVVSPNDHKRLEAALVQINNITFVDTVTNHIVETTS